MKRIINTASIVLLAGLGSVNAQAACSWIPTTLDANHYLEAALDTHDPYWAITNRNIVLTSDNLSDWAVHSGLSAAEQAALDWADVVFVSSGDPATDGVHGPRTVTTVDGVDWSVSTTSSYYALYDVVRHGGKFVAVGLWGSTVTSVDGQSWEGAGQSIGPLLSSHLFGVASGGSQMAGVGSLGFIYRSSDGASWVQQTSPTFEDLRDIAWSGHEFIAVGDKGVVVQSSNGTTWAKHAIDPTTPDLERVIWNGTTFVAVTTGGAAYRSACNSAGGAFNGGGGGSVSFWWLALLSLPLIRRR